jgi:hypothetical protein
MKTKHGTTIKLFYITINGTTAQFKAYSSITEISCILIKTSDETSGDWTLYLPSHSSQTNTE